MTCRRLSRLGLVMVALGAGLLVQPIHAEAASVTKAGWWYRTSDPASAIPRAASSPLLPDPGGEAVARPVPDGHLLVEGTPEGATAIAAIRYALNDRESSPVLTIKPADDSIAPADLLILACSSAVEWTSPKPNPGRWQDKPLVDCVQSVNGIVNDGTITFALQPLVLGGALDVVLVPGVVAETSGGKIGSTFSLSFSTADGTTLVTAKAAHGAAASQPTTEAPPSRTVSSEGPRFVAPVTPIVEPALDPQDQAPTVPRVAPPLVESAGTGNNSARRVGLGILLAGAVAVVGSQVAAARTEHDTIGLGRFRRSRSAAQRPTSTAVTGGLGRFARPRTGAPPALT